MMNVFRCHLNLYIYIYFFWFYLFSNLDMTMSLKSTVHRPNEKCCRTCPDIGLLHEPLGLGRSRLVIRKKKKKKKKEV